MQKNIVIIATASRYGGVYTIYKQFLKTLAAFTTGEVCLKNEQHTTPSNHLASDYKFYIFVDPNMKQPELPNVCYIPLETRGLRRIFFDFWQFKHIIEERKVRPDVLVSFQNMSVRYDKKTPCLIYFQTVLPLLDCRWLPFSSEERTLFFYSAIYPSYIRMLLPRRADIVVQLPFMKQEFVKTFGHDPHKISVLFPKVKIPTPETVPMAEFEADTYNFIYPVTPYIYKRNDLLIAAMAHLKKTQPELSRRLRLHFTFSPADYPQFPAQAKALGVEENIVYHGTIRFSEVLQLYKGGTGCVFPSEFESFGLPLLEAAAFGLPVIAPSRPYAQEVLANYAGAYFVPADTPEAWAAAMAEQALRHERFTPPVASADNSWETFLCMALDKASATPTDR